MSELIPYKIPSTGETVQIRKSISYAMLLMDMARETPKPKAPLQEVEIGGQVSAERNYADPDYQENLATWDANLAMRASIAVVELSIHIEMTKDRKAAVKVLRETMSHLLPLQQPDKMVWLKYVAIKCGHREAIASLYMDTSRKKFLDWLKTGNQTYLDSHFKSMAAVRRRVRFVIDADPVYIVLYDRDVGTKNRFQVRESHR